MTENEVYTKAKRILTNIKLGAQYNDIQLEYKTKEDGVFPESFYHLGEQVSNAKAINVAKEYIKSKPENL